MKKLFVLVLASIIITSCSSVKNYVTFSGKVTGNPKTITLKNKKAHVNKTIIIKNGTFKDTLKLSEPTYLALSDGESKSVVYFKNGDNIQMLLDTDNFNKVSFQGKGSEESSYMAKKAYMQGEFYKDSLFYKSKSQFENKLNAYTQVFNDELEKAKDSIFKVKQKKYIKSFEKRAKTQYKFKNYLITNLGKGTPAPAFTYPYIDKNGKEVTLKDLKGKYAYIKFWATWCSFCKKEAPYFKKISEKYKDKNINFVSISIDKERSMKLWQKMVDKENFDGIELFSKEDKKLKKIYKMNNIPRFLLIDPKGNIINADAPAPSTNEIVEFLEKI